MEYKNIIVTTKDFITTIILNRPPMNAVNLGIREEFFDAVNTLEKSRDTRVVIITGAGDKGFSAGMDVSDIANINKGPNGNEIMNTISRSTKPYIAAINGHALGGGCETAIACHFRIMADNPKALIGLPEVNLGITPGWGGIQRLPRLIGKSKALDIILFSKRLTASEALAKRPPLAIAAVLDGMSVGLDKGFDEGLSLDRQWSKKLGASKDALEGMTAFLQKREPVFIGE